MYVFALDNAETLPDFGYFFYETFATVLSVGSFFDALTSNNRTEAVSDQLVNQARLTMAMFLLMSAVVLMNILIAMMNRTYQSVTDLHETMKNVDEIDFVFWISQDNFLGVRTITRLLLSFDAQRVTTERSQTVTSLDRIF